MCTWVMSRGELAPEGFEETEWHRFDTLCEGLEGARDLPKADALLRIEGLQAETDRISEGIRADIEPREREEEVDNLKARDGGFDAQMLRAIYRQCWWGYTYRAANVSPGSRKEEDRSDMSLFTALGHSGAEPHATTRNP